MAHWNSKPERSKKQAKRERRMNQQETTRPTPPVAHIRHGAVHQALPNTIYGGYQYANGHYQARPVVPTPVDTKDTSKLSIVLMRQSVLNAISAICQPVAGASEFQVHYRALVVRVKNETNELIINIPTAYYNFKQTVAHSSVDYHLDDIDNAALVIKGTSDKVVQDILREMPILSALPVIFDGVATVTFSESNSGSIHRHPGRFGFSSTDYTKTPSNPGVIYREAEATDKVHTDSVIYLGNRTEIYTTETRILNIMPKDNGVEGTYCQLPTTTFLLNDISEEASVASVNTMIEFLGGLESEAKDSTNEYYVTNAMGAVAGYSLVSEIISAFKDAKFEQDISTVLASHIVSRSTTYTYGGAAKKYSTPLESAGDCGARWPGMYYDYDDEDDYYVAKYSTYSDSGIGGSWENGVFVPSKGSKVSAKNGLKASNSKLKNPYQVGTPGYLEWNSRNLK